MRTTPEFRAFRDDVIKQVSRTGKAGPGKNANEISFTVYGVTHRQNVLRRWVDNPSALTLIREPGNKHSRHAIAVTSAVGVVGYVPDDVAAVLAPHLDSGRLQLEIIYDDVSEFERGRETFIGVRIEVRLYPWSDDLSQHETFPI